MRRSELCQDMGHARDLQVVRLLLLALIHRLWLRNWPAHTLLLHIKFWAIRPDISSNLHQFWYNNQNDFSDASARWRAICGKSHLYVIPSAVSYHLPASFPCPHAFQNIPL